MVVAALSPPLMTVVVAEGLPLPAAVVVAVAEVAALQAPRFRARRATCRQTVETRRWR